MVKIKICGITSKSEITYLNKYKPDYAGFIFAESRRRLEPLAARALAEGLDGAIKRVGIFVNAAPGFIEHVVEIAGLDAVQLHGEETADFIKSLRYGLKQGIELWKGIRVKDEASLGHIRVYSESVDRFLLDAFVEGSYGGAGRSFDWKVARYFRDSGAFQGKGFLLAGGLKPENVEEAIEKALPFAVDVSSGVETDGVKDEAKIRDFITRVRK